MTVGAAHGTAYIFVGRALARGGANIAGLTVGAAHVTAWRIFGDIALADTTKAGLTVGAAHGTAYIFVGRAVYTMARLASP